MRALSGNLTAFLNVALFLLSASKAAWLFIGLATLGAWWFLSDYYFALWPWWMDRFAFIACSFAIFFAVTEAVLWIGIRRPARRCAPDFDSLGGSNRELKLTPVNWCATLDVIACQGGRLWAAYWHWYCARIKHLGFDHEPICANRLRTSWWFHPSAIPQWMTLGCLPAFWALLLLAPLHTNVMEHIADIAGPKPQEIFNVLCLTELQDGAATESRGDIHLRAVSEPLTREGSSSVYARTDKCVRVPFGDFVVSSTRFPRVYRSLVVSCGQGCGLDSRDTDHAKKTMEMPVIPGQDLSFMWIQTTSDPLKMTIALARQDGSTLYKAAIEP